ncbi:helix-turn-helix domain-containing protein [Sphaerisporangium sp. NPDC088356]|uniref:helix-turn-helix domain-containing protein n=1 Tax=Sphaerisporangium sp. NPDC088356 TaxID=3154871 RepID=UPI0034454D52
MTVVNAAGLAGGHRDARARIHQAQHLLETTDHTVERIGTQVRFASPTAFLDRFKRVTGVSPHTYRRTFR